MPKAPRRKIVINLNRRKDRLHETDQDRDETANDRVGSSSSRVVRGLRGPIARTVLSVAGTVADAVPVAGPPIKAVAELLQKALGAFDARDKNKELADQLSRKLSDLINRIEDTESDGERHHHLEILRNQLMDLLNRLTKMLETHSILNNSAIQSELDKSVNLVDEYLAIYSISTLASMHNLLHVLCTSVLEMGRGANFGLRLQNLFGMNLRNTYLHSPIRATVTFIDPRNKRVDVPLHMCKPFKNFKAYISHYYLADSEEPIRGSEYVKREDYILTVGSNNRAGTVFSPNEEPHGDSWNSIVDRDGEVEMGVVISVLETRFLESQSSNRCLRCNALLCSRTSSGGQSICFHCDLKTYIETKEEHSDRSDAIRSSPEQETKSGQSDIDYFANIKLRTLKSALPEQQSEAAKPEQAFPTVGSSIRDMKMHLNNYRNKHGLSIPVYSDTHENGIWTSTVSINGINQAIGKNGTKLGAHNAAAAQALFHLDEEYYNSKTGR